MQRQRQRDLQASINVGGGIHQMQQQSLHAFGVRLLVRLAHPLLHALCPVTVGTQGRRLTEAIAETRQHGNPIQAVQTTGGATPQRFARPLTQQLGARNQSPKVPPHGEVTDLKLNQSAAVRAIQTE